MVKHSQQPQYATKNRLLYMPQMASRGLCIPRRHQRCQRSERIGYLRQRRLFDRILLRLLIIVFHQSQISLKTDSARFLLLELQRAAMRQTYETHHEGIVLMGVDELSTSLTGMIARYGQTMSRSKIAGWRPGDIGR
jgi:hypothetical protein